jgi:MFS family permease
LAWDLSFGGTFHRLLLPWLLQGESHSTGVFWTSFRVILIIIRRYNIGILATVYVSPGFIQALSKPTASQTGLITAIYYLGTWISYIFLSALTSDRLGRRYAALTGTVVTCVGTAMQAGAKGRGAFALMIIGRIICGFGNAIISTSVPLYQRLEISCSCYGRWADDIPQ